MCDRHALGLLVILAALAAEAPGQNGDFARAFEARRARLTRVRVEYDWFQCKAPLKSDPYDRSNWIEHEPGAFTIRFRASILRPDFRLERRGEQAFNRDLKSSWIEGVSTTVNLDADGGHSVQVTPDRFNITGPLPLITPLELQTFDVQDSLFDLYKAGRLRRAAEMPTTVTLETAELGPVPWRIRAVLDKARDLAPRSINATLDVPGSGVIKWSMRVSGWHPVGETYVISDAIITLSNSAVDRREWQVYSYHATRIESVPQLSQHGLEISIPSRNVRITDEIRGYTRRVNSDGRVTYETQFTPEERKEQLQDIAKAWTLRAESARRLVVRRRIFIGILVSGAFGTLAMGGWLWRRRHPKLT